MNSRKDYQKALELRLIGQSYGKIREILKIPKSTLSTWFSGLKIDSRAQKILKSKQKNGYYKLLEFNKIRTQNILKENEGIRSDYESRIDKLNDRELMILGATLYWGKGYKNFNIKKKGAYPYICFGNSDPETVIIFMRFLERILAIDKNRIKAQIMIYPNLSPQKSTRYWQSITQIPKDNFRCQVTVSRASQGKRPYMLPFGTLQLRVNQRQEFFKIRGLIDGIIKSLR